MKESFFPDYQKILYVILVFKIVRKRFWEEVTAAAKQCSNLGPLFFVTYITDFFEGLKFNSKHVADDTSLFSGVKDIDLSKKKINEDLTEINN